MPEHLTPLFMTDEEIAPRIASKLTAIESKAMAIIYERHGLPKRDPLMGGRRYWPAVVRFFELQYGIQGQQPLKQTPTEYLQSEEKGSEHSSDGRYKGLFSVNQVAERWLCSPALVRTMVRKNQIRYVRVGKLIRTPLEAILEIEAGNTEK